MVPRQQRLEALRTLPLESGAIDVLLKRWHRAVGCIGDWHCAGQLRLLSITGAEW